MTKPVVKVRRDLLEACMKCPLCNKLMKEATTVSLCLHTFCRKCIYEKLSDDAVETCPVCDIQLGCLPLEKLRPDHNLQDIRFKIFPYERMKVENPQVVIHSNSPPPTKRKERSLSSLVVNAPKMSPKISGLACLTGRRSKTSARTASSIGGCNFTGDNDPEMKKISLFSNSSHVEHNIEPKSNEDPENEMVTLGGKADTWTPLNSLLEAINRTKLLKTIKQDPSVFHDFKPGGSKTKAKEEITGGSEIFTAKKKKKKRNYLNKEVQDEINYTSLSNGAVKRRKLRVTARNTGNVFRRRSSSVWFSLVPSKDQRGVDSLPKVSGRYLRMKDGKVPVSSIQKYLVKKLDLTSESEGGACTAHSVTEQLGGFVAPEGFQVEESDGSSRLFRQGLCDGSVLLLENSAPLKQKSLPFSLSGGGGQLGHSVLKDGLKPKTACIETRKYFLAAFPAITTKMQQAGGSETVVTWEDQQNINKFGRLNNRFHELEDEIKTAKETCDNLEDAGNELILTDEEIVRFQIGEVFVHVPKDEVETRIEEMKEATSKNMERLVEEKESIVAQMAELKKILYGKFKDSINLEED